MTLLTEVAQRKVQHICIFGDPKSGKSELAGSLAYIFRRVVWVSIDNGHEVLFKLPLHIQKKVELIRLPDTKEFPVAITTCLELVKGTNCHICDLHGQVSCRTCIKENASGWTDISLGALQLDEVIVFDHITQVADSAMNFVTKDKKLDYRAEWPDYAYQGALMSKFLMNIQQAPYNCVCIAHVAETEMEDGSKKLVPLVGTVPFSRNAGKYFDHIIYSRVANKKHNFGSATTYIASVLTGSRTDIILEKQTEERPTLLPFFEGKMEHLSTAKIPESNVTPLLRDIKEEVSTSVSTYSGTEDVEQTKELLEVENKVTEVPELSPAEAAKARIAAMKAAKIAAALTSSTSTAAKKE